MPYLDSIKRAARKEAWYGNSYNPFRKVNSNRWSVRGDEEQGDSVRESPLSTVRSEPIPESPHEYDPVEHTMTAPDAGRTSHPDSRTTATTFVDKEKDPPQAEETKKPRRRFVPGFLQKGEGEEEGEGREEKRAWYKGKKLYHKEPFTVRNQLERTVFNSWVNILLLAAPAGIAINYAGINGKIVFVVNFIAIIPLAGMLSFATEEIALHVGESLGGLLNASFGYVSDLCAARDRLTTTATPSR
jgi:Ca2+:H+ antiporter